MNARTAVVWIPDWPLVVARAVHEVSGSAPAVVVSNRKIRVASGYARATGIRTGMALRHAQELCPEIIVLEGNESLEAREFEYVAQLVESVVPHLDIIRPGLLTFGAFGPTRYFGSEEALASALVDVLARDAQCEAYVGFAEGLLAAVLSARMMRTIEPGKSAEFLQQRPLTEVHYALTHNAQRTRVRELVALWDRLGIRTFGQLAALPKTDVTTRFGAEGEYIHALVSGLDVYAVQTQHTRPEIHVHASLEPPATRVDEAAFHGRTLAQRLYTELLEQSATCGRITISARMNDGTELHRSWRTDDTALGAMSPERITQRVRWQLEGWLTNSALRQQARAQRERMQHSAQGTRYSQGNNRPDHQEQLEGDEARAQLLFEDQREHQSVVEIVWLELQAQDVTGAATHQESLWGARSGNDIRARRAAERVASLIGPHNVHAVQMAGGRTYQDRFTLVPWDSDDAMPLAATTPGGPGANNAPFLTRASSTTHADSHGSWPGSLPSPGPTLLCQPPQEIEVLDTHDNPVRFSHRLAMSGTPATVLWLGDQPQRLAIEQWAGPWPITTGWWRAQAQRALYFQLVPHDHRPLLVAYRPGLWQCEGIYD